ncbi:TasA family protein [Patescibacteria group bacterium]
MKKILRSTFVIAVAALLMVGATRAYFSDTETSENNRFVAGAIDLTIDSEAHYNGLVCLDPGDGYVWTNRDALELDPYMASLVGLPCTGSWEATDLDGERFFDYEDLKPGDMGENTISMHVYDNDAYMCVYIEDMLDGEIPPMTEPEEEAGDNPADLVGELSQEIHFFAWADDGDNVFEPENGEFEEYPLFSNVEGPASDVLDGKVYPLYTPETEVFPGGEERFIGVAWCYGEFEVDLGSGVMACDGGPVSNMSQTDFLSANIRFYVEQARNNEEFACPELGPQPENRHISLENKNSNWEILPNDLVHGDIHYSHNDTSFKGTVTGTGLEANKYYQITLNGPGGCTFTDHGFAGVGPNAFSSGYWNNGTNLEPTCGTPGEGVYNMDLIGDHYTFQADGSGAFTHNFDIALPAGDYSGVKVLVKKMLDTHVSPWADTGTGYPAFNLYETAAISFTVL